MNGTSEKGYMSVRMRERLFVHEIIFNKKKNVSPSCIGMCQYQKSNAFYAV